MGGSFIRYKYDVCIKKKNVCRKKGRKWWEDKQRNKTARQNTIIKEKQKIKKYAKKAGVRGKGYVSISAEVIKQTNRKKK